MTLVFDPYQSLESREAINHTRLGSKSPASHLYLTHVGSLQSRRRHMQTANQPFDLSLIREAAKSGIVPVLPGYEVVLWEGDVLHSHGKIFCYNPKCPCHKSRVLIEIVARFVSDGLLTPQEATKFVSGKLI